MSGDGAKVSVLVDVPPAEAFAMFTDEIDEWWRTGPAYRIAGKTRYGQELAGLTVQDATTRLESAAESAAPVN